MQAGTNWNGQYSRWTFDETKGYMGVLKEFRCPGSLQRVPLLDAELNENQDTLLTLIRRVVHRMYGDGTNGVGFKIVESSTSTVNNFTIKGGDGVNADGAEWIFVDGWSPIILDDIDYTGQSDVTPLTTPTGGSPRTDEVYIDVWLDEVGPADDSLIIDSTIGFETSRRLKLKWVVKVSEGGSTPLDYNDANGLRHWTLKLATLVRISGNANILTSMIADQRNDSRTFEYPFRVISEFHDSLSEAVTALTGTDATLIVHKHITSDTSEIPNNIQLYVLRGGLITVPEEDTLTIRQQPVAGVYQIFAGEGSVLLPGLTAMLNWWVTGGTGGSGSSDRWVSSIDSCAGLASAINSTAAKIEMVAGHYSATVGAPSLTNRQVLEGAGYDNTTFHSYVEDAPAISVGAIEKLVTCSFVSVSGFTVNIHGDGATGIMFNAARHFVTRDIKVWLGGNSQIGVWLSGEEVEGGVAKGVWWSSMFNTYISGELINTENTGMKLSGAYNSGQVNTNGFYNTRIYGVKYGINVSASMGNRWFQVCIEHIATDADAYGVNWDIFSASNVIYGLHCESASFSGKIVKSHIETRRDCTITHSGTIATVHLEDHGYTEDLRISVSGCTEPQYNSIDPETNVDRKFRIVDVSDEDHFTYTMLSEPTGDATGAPQVRATWGGASNNMVRDIFPAAGINLGTDLDVHGSNQVSQANWLWVGAYSDNIIKSRVIGTSENNIELGPEDMLLTDAYRTVKLLSGGSYIAGIRNDENHYRVVVGDSGIKMSDGTEAPWTLTYCGGHVVKENVQTHAVSITPNLTYGLHVRVTVPDLASPKDFTLNKPINSIGGSNMMFEVYSSAGGAVVSFPVDDWRLTPWTPTDTAGAIVPVTCTVRLTGAITRVDSTVTVHMVGHGFNNLDYVTIGGCVQTEYNGDFEVTVTGPDDFTYTCTGTPATPATGSRYAFLTSNGEYYQMECPAGHRVTIPFFIRSADSSPIQVGPPFKAADTNL